MNWIFENVTSQKKTELNTLSLSSAPFNTSLAFS